MRRREKEFGYVLILMVLLFGGIVALGLYYSESTDPALVSLQDSIAQARQDSIRDHGILERIRERFEDYESNRTYQGYIGIDGRLFQRVSEGDWAAFMEQAAAFIKTLEGQVWILDLDQRDTTREGQVTFQFLDLDEKCEVGIFVSLPHECVLKEEFLTWIDIKEFLYEKMIWENLYSLVGAVERYLQEKGLL